VFRRVFLDPGLVVHIRFSRRLLFLCTTTSPNTFI
jgi:hypothetical protein